MTAADRAQAPADLVIGVGHSYRSDDAAGPVVARALAERGLPAIVHEGEGSALLDLWQGLDHVIVVDAVAGSEPGTLHRLDTNSGALPKVRFVHSTHDLGLPEALALGERFDRLPARLSIIGITGSDFSIGEDMTAPVRAATMQVIDELTALLSGD